MKIRVEKQIGDLVLSFEIGQLAKQATACVIAQYGDTIVLNAVTIYTNLQIGCREYQEDLRTS